jgi:hypothetical protein
MHTFIRRIIVVALVPAAQLLLSEAGAQGKSTQQSVTGHAEFITIPGNHAMYSLSAIRLPDGRVAGQLELHVQTAGGEFIRRVHGRVTCLTVTENVARVGGVVEQLTGSQLVPPGTHFFMTITDNGEGGNEPRDLTSNARGGPEGSDIAHCTTGTQPPEFPIVRGELQVRPTFEPVD